MRRGISPITPLVVLALLFAFGCEDEPESRTRGDDREAVMTESGAAESATAETATAGPQALEDIPQAYTFLYRSGPKPALSSKEGEVTIAASGPAESGSIPVLYTTDLSQQSRALRSQDKL